MGVTMPAALPKVLKTPPASPASLRGATSVITAQLSDATFYNWKSKYGGLTVSDAARLRTLEDENRRLKKLLAESMLDVSALKDLLGKN